MQRIAPENTIYIATADAARRVSTPQHHTVLLGGKQLPAKSDSLSTQRSGVLKST